MVEKQILFGMPHLTRIEPDQRLVVLARTMQARNSESETSLKNGVIDRVRYRETYLGGALYRHRSIFKSNSEAPTWSHLELSYFQDVVPADIIYELVLKPRPVGTQLLRAEILLTTPSAFVMPRDWQGLADHADRQVSLEYIDVRAEHLAEYRDIMRKYIGPAATRLVGADKIGTFRTMETAAVLYRDPSLTIDWNQIHLSEVDARSFRGFGQEFDIPLREIFPDGGFVNIFAGLDRIRAIPRWTFNEAVVEADVALGRLGLV
jgi:hypothetical protein